MQRFGILTYGPPILTTDVGTNCNGVEVQLVAISAVQIQPKSSYVDLGEWQTGTTSSLVSTGSSPW